VAISGHDHVCAALGVGAIAPGLVFDSMGTAETLVGAAIYDQARGPGEPEYRSGLTYGCHVVPGTYYWMGGLSASGGSVEWLRQLCGEPPLSYAALESLLNGITHRPSGILYFPYLAGSGAPHADPAARAAFVGLAATHGRAEMTQAVLEGTAYEMEVIRRAAERATGDRIERIIAAGGGTRNRHWLQIKADVSGCRFDVAAQPEAALLGAALAAGTGCGVYADATEAVAATAQPPAATILPDEARHGAYARLYEQGYLALQAPLRQVVHELGTGN
jgi:sugar (pentulose or hexulose) kinase